MLNVKKAGLLTILCCSTLNILSFQVFNSNDLSVSEIFCNRLVKWIQKEKIEKNIVLVRYEDPAKLSKSFAYLTPQGSSLVQAKADNKPMVFIPDFNQKDYGYLVVNELLLNKLTKKEQKYWFYNVSFFIKNDIFIKKVKNIMPLAMATVGISALLTYKYNPINIVLDLMYKLNCISHLNNNLYKEKYDKNILKVPAKLGMFLLAAKLINIPVDLFMKYIDRDIDYQADKYSYSKIKDIETIKSALSKSGFKSKDNLFLKRFAEDRVVNIEKTK